MRSREEGTGQTVICGILDDWFLSTLQIERVRFDELRWYPMTSLPVARCRPHAGVLAAERH
ncbi:hypothetical protein, partial [Olsenella uli]|uniref:hypothetical protein n=1 Tax=Olsenella uli TaxID=133926 RepID=UPI0028F00F5C